MLHVWVPSHRVARECATIGHELTSQLPNCTVMAVVVVAVVAVAAVVVVVEVVVVVVVVMVVVLEVAVVVVVMMKMMVVGQPLLSYLTPIAQMWITVCEEPDIYTNKSSKAPSATKRDVT